MHFESSGNFKTMFKKAIISECGAMPVQYKNRYMMQRLTAQLQYMRVAYKKTKYHCAPTTKHTSDVTFLLYTCLSTNTNGSGHIVKNKKKSFCMIQSMY